MAAKSEDKSAVTPTKQPVADAPTAPVLKYSSIGKKRAEAGANASVFIQGRSSAGKTTQAIKCAKGKTLVFCFGGLDTYYAAEAAQDFIIPTDTLGDWTKFMATYITPIRVTGSLDGEKFDTVILDDLNILLAHVVRAIGGDQPSQNDWGKISRALFDLVSVLKMNFRNVIVTCNIGQKDDGTWATELNRQSYTYMKGLLSQKHLTYVRVLDYDDNGDVLGLFYGVETNPTLALNHLVSALPGQE